ncbi:2'-5' RNA ligase family protein [Nocardioides sp. MAHUQ-72]|uniref:2'-5' RNA ligase family protein n=1 Tax=unclassified Nocardioides TaxID=2615069 RepID=UPI003614DF95
MALAVCLLLDRRSDRLVRDLWARLEEQGVRTLASHTHGRHLPHLSYAVLRSWDLASVQTALAGLPDGGPVTLHCHGTLTFPRGRAALAPAVTAGLAARQQAVVERVAGCGDLHHNYRPGWWVPHVSVATRAQGAAMATVVRMIADTLPLALHADRAALVDSATGRTWPLDAMP